MDLQEIQFLLLVKYVSLTKQLKRSPSLFILILFLFFLLCQGHTVITVIALDQDKGINDAMIYSIESKLQQSKLNQPVRFSVAK